LNADSFFLTDADHQRELWGAGLVHTIIKHRMGMLWEHTFVNRIAGIVDLLLGGV